MTAQEHVHQSHGNVLLSWIQVKARLRGEGQILSPQGWGQELSPPKHDNALATEVKNSRLPPCGGDCPDLHSLSPLTYM